MAAVLAWLALFSAVGMAQDPTNLMFYGGAYDGWDRDAMTNGVGLGGAWRECRGYVRNRPPCGRGRRPSYAGPCPR